jgi:hypothetical protein
MSWWNYPTDAGPSQALSRVDPGGGFLPSLDFPFQLLSLLSALRFQLFDFVRSRHPKLLSFVAKRLPGWQQSLGTRGIS